MALPLQFMLRAFGMELGEDGELLYKEDGTLVPAYEEATTMDSDTKESIIENLKKIKEMNSKDSETVISQFRKRWQKSKKAYNSKEQERLRNEFNTACPELEL